MSGSASSDYSSPGDVAVAITSSIVGGMIIIVIAISIIRCIQKTRMQSTNASVLPTTHSGAIATMSLTSSVMNEDSQVDMASMERFLHAILKEKPARFTPQHLVDFTNNYAEKLGSGGFGEVYKGQFPNGVRVAVKVLHRTLDKRAEEQFMAEVATIGRTYHINLVRLYGFCFHDGLKALIYEYVDNGPLDRYLFDEKHKLEYGQLYDIAIGTAKGIRYLHEECQKKIVHYDIKPGNVLLDANFSPKVADFGLAKLCDRDHSHVAMTGGRGTPGYAAPELWMPYPVTRKCDVYSFGMLLFEILGQRRNLESRGAESQEWFPRWIWEKIENGELESVISVCRIKQKHKEKADRMCKVALWCVQYLPEARPSMNNVVTMLEGDEKIMTPWNPFRHINPFDAVSKRWRVIAEQAQLSSETRNTTSEVSSKSR